MLKSEKHRHSQALLAMSVFAFSRQDGVGKTSFVGFCQVKSRPKGSCVTQFKAVYGSVPFGQAGGLERRTRPLSATLDLTKTYKASFADSILPRKSEHRHSRVLLGYAGVFLILTLMC